MSGDINTEILITSDIQGLHGVALEVDASIVFEIAAEAFFDANEAFVDQEIEILSDALGISGYEGSIDLTFEIASSATGTSGFFGDLVSELNPSTTIVGGTGPSGETSIEIDITPTSGGIFGYEATLASAILVEIASEGEHSIGMVIAAEIEFELYGIFGLHGRGSNLAGNLIISSNSRALAFDSNTFLGNISAPIVVQSTTEAVVVDSIVSQVEIECAAEGIFIPPLFVIIEGEIVGLTGNFPREGSIGQADLSVDPPIFGLDIEIGFSATGVYGQIHTGTISSNVIITPNIVGIIPPIGQSSNQIVIACSATGESTTINSLFGFIPIDLVSSGISGEQSADISSQVEISSNINALTGFIQAQVASTVVLELQSTGVISSNGFVDSEIEISGRPTNRARSFLPNGEPVPQSFRNGIIDQVIEIGCEAISDDEDLFGVIEASFEIFADINTNRGQVLGRAGDIDAPIIIQGFLRDAPVGLDVTKISNSAVITGLTTGIGVSKTSNFAVTSSPNDGIILGKSVIYAVIGPDENEVPIVDAAGYEAILFF